MALIIRSNSDLVYLPDHGFVGEEGALRILVQITRQTRRLDVSHNLLGTDGTLTLIQGLTSLRGRYSTPELGLWGLAEINLGCNGLKDKAIEGVMAYAKKDVMLRKLLLQGNEIELRDHLDSTINSLNASRLRCLSLTNNRSLRAESVSRLLSSMTTSHLTELHLSMCNIGTGSIGDITSYLLSSRSRNLEILELNGNAFGSGGVTEIVDAVERGNFTIRRLGLFGCNNKRARSEGQDDDGDIDMENELWHDDLEFLDPGSREELFKEQKTLEYETTKRLPSLVNRNNGLCFRARMAAIRCLPAARILLNAQPPPSVILARQAIEAISTGTPTAHFRLLDLPREVLYLIVRHTSRDPRAFSDAQYARLRKDAEGKEGLHRLERIMRAKQRPWADKADLKEANMEVREEWLRWGKWDKWECDVPLAPS